MRKSLKFGWFIGALALVGCMDQYDPRPYWKQFSEERAHANQPQPKLTDDGKLPEVAAVADTSAPAKAQNPIDEKYANFCASCHGPEGKGDGAAGQALNPKPRDFSDAAWQKSVDDARIAKVIKEGGAAVGLSPVMAPWGGVLNEGDILEMVKKVRSFSK